MDYPALFIEFLASLKQIEGGYSNNPKDAGGETNHGITVAVARRHGYNGPMSALPYSLAQKIYFVDYWQKLGLDKIGLLSADVTLKLADIGVNCGVGRAGLWLQRSLNVLNNPNSKGVKPWPDLMLDSDIGPKTQAAFRAFLVMRKAEGEIIMFRMLNCLQGAHYITTPENYPQNEEFVYGWFKNRIA